MEIQIPRQTKHEDGSDDENNVKGGKSNQKAIDGTLHLWPANMQIKSSSLRFADLLSEIRKQLIDLCIYASQKHNFASVMLQRPRPLQLLNNLNLALLALCVTFQTGCHRGKFAGSFLKIVALIFKALPICLEI